MDSAELYMLLIRPSMVPIIGEAWTIPFNLQVEIGTWGWKISNSDELRRASKEGAKYSERKTSFEAMTKAKTAVGLQEDLAKIQAGFAADDIKTSIKELEKEARNLKEPEDAEATKARALKLKSLNDQISNRDAFIANKLKDFKTDLDRKARGEKNDKDQLAKDREDATRSAQDKIDDAMKENFQFRFSKRVDFASTQMLNSMKQGDVFPTGIITVFQRAPKIMHAASLILTVQKMRLLDYKLRCEVSDTMTDMREDWVAEFTTLNYVYKSRGMIKSESGAQLVTAAITQGTPRVFSMSLKFGSPI